MRDWRRRAPEVAHLNNPAFCAELSRRVAHVYSGRVRQPIPSSLLFLAIPILLHRETRESLSVLTRMKMHAWLQEHPSLRIGFAHRARQFAPHVVDALSFLVCTGAGALDQNGGLVVASKPKPITGDDDAVSDIYRKAGTVGRWLAGAGTPEASFTTWGVRP